jgi:hypothetical protein
MELPQQVRSQMEFGNEGNLRFASCVAMPKVRYEMGQAPARGDVMTNLVLGTIFFSLFTLNWASLAAYVGLTAFLTTLPQQPRLGVFIFTSATIFIPTIIFLGNQNFFYRLDRFDFYDHEATRVFHVGRFILNACFCSGMALSLLSGRYLPPQLRRSLRLTCLWAMAFSMLWMVGGPGGIFISILFVPNSDWLASRLIFIALFLAISGVTFWRLSAIHNRGGTDSAT